MPELMHVYKNTVYSVTVDALTILVFGQSF